MNTPSVQFVRRLASLRTIRNACFAFGGWAFVAMLGFMSARGAGRGLDPANPFHTAALVAAVILTFAGFALWTVMILREAAARRFWAEVGPVVTVHLDEAAHLDPTAATTAPAGRDRPAHQAG